MNENTVKPTPEAIRFQNISYTYGKGTPFEKTALCDISFSVPANCTTGIIGHTGSGKSTLVQLMNGLLTPEKGRVLLFGEDIWAQPKKIREVRFRVGLVFQYPEYQLFEETVEKDIAFGPRNMGLSGEEIGKRVKEAAAFVGIGEELLQKSPFALSGGQKRRVAIAGVIAMRPEVLILDEPAAGLDPLGREEIFDHLREYRRKTQSTMLIVSHSMEDMAKYADRVIVMRKGELLLEGSCHDVFCETGLLRENGLNIPQITLLLQRLHSCGLDVRTDIFTVEDAKNMLLPLLRGGGKDA